MNNTNLSNQQKELNTKSLWDSDICKQTDEDRKKNPEKYIAMDIKISNMLDHINKHSGTDENIIAQNILNNLKSNSITIDNLSTRQLAILKRVYGNDWKDKL